jgi:hypothetical protein
MGTVRLVWVEPPDALQGWEAEVSDQLLERGSIELSPELGLAGPSGTYRLLPEELWRTMHPHDPVPTFLHESYEGCLEKWVNSLPDAASEVAVVGRVRDAVIQLVESRLAADPQAVPASVTVTTTEPTPQGMAVVGRCVVLRPNADVGMSSARRQRRPPTS